MEKACSENPVVYLFDWGDGIGTGWLDSNSAAKSYSSNGTYSIKSKTRCSWHGIESHVGPALQVIISDTGPDLSARWTNSVTQSCRNTYSGQKCNVSGSLEVKNIGDKSAPRFSVEFYLSDDQYFDQLDTFLKSTSVISMPAGMSRTGKFSYSLQPGTSASNKYIIAVVKSNEDIDPSNNTAISNQIK